MAEFKEISCKKDLEGILEESRLRKIIIFKHSTTCPISARAWQEVQDFITEGSEEILVTMIKVIESRSVSNQVTEDLEVKHQSPQVLLLSDRQVLWHASHHDVTKINIEKASKDEILPFNLTNK